MVTGACFRNPSLLFTFGKDNPFSATLFLLPWSILLIVIMILVTRCACKRSKKRKMMKRFLPNLKKVVNRDLSETVTFEKRNQKVKIIRPSRAAPPPPSSTPVLLENRPLPEIPKESADPQEGHLDELKDKIKTFTLNKDRKSI